MQNFKGFLNLKLVSGLFFLFVFSFALKAESFFKWDYNISDGKLTVSVGIPEYHYLYSDKTLIKLEDSSGLQIMPVSVPETVNHKDEYGEYKIYREGINKWDFALRDKSSLILKISFQGCAKKPFVCFPPETLEFKIAGEDIRNSALKKTGTASDTSMPVDSAVSTTQKNQHLDFDRFISEIISKGGLWFFIAAFIGGFISAFTPCVLPLIPITLAILGADVKSSRRKALGKASLYVLGIVLTFTALAALAAFTGKTFGGQILGNPIVIWFFAVLFIALGLSMLGVYDLQFPSSIQIKLNRIGGSSGTGAFLMGLTAGFVAVPCTGPILVTLLGIVAASGKMFFGIPLLAAYALGFGFPLLALGAGAAKIPKSGPFADVLKSILGIAILCIAIFALTIASPALKSLIETPWCYARYAALIMVASGILLGAVNADGHSSKKIVRISKITGAFILAMGIVWTFKMPCVSKGTETVKINWETSIEKAIEKSSETQKMIFMDFTAEWCFACEEMEALTFSAPDLADELNRHWIPLRIDGTVNSDELQNMESMFGVKGYPSIIILSPKRETKKSITGFISAERLLKELKTIKD